MDHTVLPAITPMPDNWHTGSTTYASAAVCTMSMFPQTTGLHETFATQ